MSDVPQGPGWWQASDGLWYAPGLWYPLPEAKRPAARPPTPPDKVEPAVAIIFGVILAVVVVIVAIALVVGPHLRRRVVLPTPPTITVPPGRPPGYTGPAYPGIGRLDHVADSSGRVEAEGYIVTAKHFAPVNSGNGRELCGSVTYTNTSAANAAYDFFLDWKLQQPNGVPVTPDPNGHISSGNLQAGASNAGDVCFDDGSQHGQFVLIWLPLSLGSLQRGIWLFQLW